MKVARINYLTINVSGRSKTEMNMLLEVEDLPCDHIEFVYQSRQSPYLYLQALFYKNQSLKDVSLYSYCLPPPFAFPQITELHLELEESIKSLICLEWLVNLEVLEITTLTFGYRFGHEPVALITLKEFELNIRETCENCFKALANSFKNLRPSIIRTKSCVNSIIIIEMLFKHWRSLQHMTIEGVTFEL